MTTKYFSCLCMHSKSIIKKAWHEKKLTYLVSLPSCVMYSELSNLLSILEASMSVSQAVFGINAIAIIPRHPCQKQGNVKLTMFWMILPSTGYRNSGKWGIFFLPHFHDFLAVCFHKSVTNVLKWSSVI